MNNILDYVENTELRGTDRFESHTIPQPLNPLREPVDEMFPAAFVNIGGSSLMIGFVARKHVEGTDHDRVGHSHDGAFLTPARGQALIQGRHIGILSRCATGGMKLACTKPCRIRLASHRASL